MEQARSLPGLLVLLALINIRYNVSLQIDLTSSPTASLDQVSGDHLINLLSSLHSGSFPQVSSRLPAPQLDLIHSHPQPPVYFSRGESPVPSPPLVLRCKTKIVCKTVINQVRPELILLLCNWQLEHWH